MSDYTELQKKINALFSGNGPGFTLKEIEALRKAFALIIAELEEEQVY